MARTGRRAGDAGTRATIIEAARAEFAGSGYTAATIRAIARRAEVDPALIYHYFADKPSLFVATQELPRDPRDIRRDTQASGSPGVRLVESFLAQWEADPREPGQSFVTLAQAVSSSPEVARSLREFLSERIWAGRQDTSAEMALKRRCAVAFQRHFGAAGRAGLEPLPRAAGAARVRLQAGGRDPDRPADRADHAR
jgi:AcrR family transcriptional regulator